MPYTERQDRVNWSTLKWILTSPKHYRHALATPFADSPAKKLGRLIHTAILEPHKLEARYVVSPNFHRGMKDETAIAKGYEGGREAAAEFDLQLSEWQEVVSADDLDRARMARDAFTLPPGIAHEMRIEWTDPDTGIACRGRVDYLGADLIDIKTTNSIHNCERDAARYMYHAQLAWYFDGLINSGANPNTAQILFIESSAPFDSLLAEFDLADLDAGRALYRKALATLRTCRDRNEWPGFAPTPRRIKLPEWAFTNTEDPLTLGGVALEF